MPWSLWILAAFVLICNGFIRQRGKGSLSRVYFEWLLHLQHLERTFLCLICTSLIATFARGFLSLFKFQNICKTWLIPRQGVKQAPKSKAASEALFKQKSMKPYTRYTLPIHSGDAAFVLRWFLGAHIPLHQALSEFAGEREGEHPALGRVQSMAKGKWEGILTTHLLATNLAVKCNQLVSPGSLCSQGRESKAPAEGHSVHPN